MLSEPFVLIDQERMLVFAHPCSGRLVLRDTQVLLDDSGITWTWTEVGRSGIGLTWLGPGRIWDAAWVADNHDKLEHDLEAMRNADSGKHRAELGRVVSQLRLGELAGRTLFAIHRAVLFHKSSLVTVADTWLAEMVWGRIPSARPRHWRSVLREILSGLTWLHVADVLDSGTPTFDAASVLITHAGDLCGTAEDECPGDCGARRDLRHHHFQIDIGPGFLGVLDQFGRDADGSGIRDYRFPVGSRRKTYFPSLKVIGKSGRLVSAFTPAFTGERQRCQTLSAGAHRILQTLIRETTRPVKHSKKLDPRTELVLGSRLRTYSGRSSKPCTLLATEVEYVGFNGNGKRRAMGYRLLASQWSWPLKAGYPTDAVPEFLDDLLELAASLELVVVGVGPSAQFVTLNQLRGLAQTAMTRRTLSRIDVRVFTRSDYVQRWSRYFESFNPAESVEDVVDFDVRLAMQSQKLSCRTLASAIGCDHSFLAKILNGKKRWPELLLKNAKKYLACARSGTPMPPERVGKQNQSGGQKL